MGWPSNLNGPHLRLLESNGFWNILKIHGRDIRNNIVDILVDVWNELLPKTFQLTKHPGADLLILNQLLEAVVVRVFNKLKLNLDLAYMILESNPSTLDSF